MQLMEHYLHLYYVWIKTNIMKKLVLFIAVALSVSVFDSCQKEYSETAPVLPPVESIMPDLTSFGAVTKASANKNEYYAYVADYVMSNWQTLFQQIINVPIEGFEQFVHIYPVNKGNGIWEWHCDVKDGFTTYSIFLLGKEERNHVNWELSVSSEGLITLKNFVWLTGESSKDGREGEWKVLVGPCDLLTPTEVAVKSKWECDASRSVTKVELTYELGHLCCGINPFFQNSKITYLKSASSSDYNRSVNAYYNHLGLGWWSADVEWNTENGAGRVMCNSKWNDGQWHEWPAYVMQPADPAE